MHFHGASRFFIFIHMQQVRHNHVIFACTDLLTAPHPSCIQIQTSLPQTCSSDNTQHDAKSTCSYLIKALSEKQKTIRPISQYEKARIAA